MTNSLPLRRVVLPIAIGAASCASCKSKSANGPTSMSGSGTGGAGSAMEGSGSAAGSAASPASLLLLLGQPAETSPNPALMSLVVSLRDPADHHLCTATPIADSVLLTAAHCLQPSVTLHAAARGRAISLSPATIDERACEGDQDCRARLPDTVDGIAEDIGTARVPGLKPATYPRLEHVRFEDMPPAYLLSAQRDVPLVVCRSQVTYDVGYASGSEVSLGDSGSPVVAVTADGPVVLGIESHRTMIDHRWYFVVIPSRLPWPRDTPTQPPEVDDVFDASSFLPIPQCP